ncbi:transposase [Alloalcanivorax xenomutans]|uniref:transposase n=1 Tax=Alloalcanivorax xenomutans TaxID=1094342 RepID=UPI003C671D8C
MQLFFEQLGERCQQIKVAAIDMNTASAREVKQRCPKAEAVFDLLNAVVLYRHKMADRVRVDQTNALWED